MNGSGSIMRIFALALVAIGFWSVGRYVDNMPAPRGPDAPPTEFSAARADATLGRLLGPEVPHPVSTDANKAVRDRIRAAFAALGVKTTIYRATGCNGRPKYGFFVCGTVEDILADVAPGEGKAIVLLAHYDSVPAGPGASDDQSGVATVLETVRALKARGLKTSHPILAVITDGEEAGLLGASAFVADPALKARVGVAVNVEARGNSGPSLLFQTSPGDGPLIDLYDRSVPTYATSSLFAVIYRLLPNDTDLTVFLNAGFTGYNFAFTGNVAHYHTLLDRRANLDPSTLQMHGNNLLGVVSSLEQTDFTTLKGSDDIYLTLLGRFIPRLPVFWALPLAVFSLLLLAAAVFLSRDEVLGIGRRLSAAAIPLVTVLGAAAFGWVLHEVASLVSGQPDPSYAYPVWLRISLGLGVLSVLIYVSRMASARLTALSVWGWFALLALVTAALVPGISPYFLFPALVGTALLVAQSRLPSAWTGTMGQLLILLAALLPLLIWLGFAATGEGVQGLALHPLFTVPVAFGTMTLLPLLAARPLPRPIWLWSGTATAVLALVAAVVAGLQPAYSPWQPQRLDINFVDDHIGKKALWTIDTPAPLPGSLRAVANFSARPDLSVPVSLQPSYSAPAGALRFDLPTADVVSVPQGSGRMLALAVRGAPGSDRIVVLVPREMGLVRVSIDGKPFEPSPDSLNPRGTIIACVTTDCHNKSMRLTFATRRPLDLLIAEQHYGLPPDGARLAGARPHTAIPSQSGDTTIVFGNLHIP